MADEAKAPESKPNGRTTIHDLIDVVAALFTSDNLVVVSLTAVTMYCIYKFGATNPDIIEKVVTFVAGGLVGYLGGEAKKSITKT